ncbi:DUF885 domain-containing protein [Sphingomonas oleivorans]|uniref:DUF885 domain-containing protein n=1 Tax=Sphingomonas oleivorans TaxID=1735121 RepID=A0A2T5FXX5_9SPHN|nr:DUF885 domain-containing protein [Sphingomonas oleivorans]PTQ10924.1 DUF885 domain-containing protein [Sphingomonas oleivorans]
MRFFLFAAALALSAPATAAPGDDLRALIADHWRWHLDTHPTLASSLGDRSGDGRLADISLAARDRDAERAGAFLDRLEAIPDAGLNGPERENKAILARLLREQVEANRFAQREILLTTYSAWHQEFAGLANDLPFRTRADYQSYLDRLAAYPAYNREAMRITQKAVADGLAQPCEAMAGYDRTISGLIAEDPSQSRYYRPFQGARPADMSEADWAAMRRRAAALIRDSIYPENRALLDYYRKGYAPNCRKTLGASAMPGGAGWYAAEAKVMTTTDMTPAQIHALGLSEVARIRAEMETVARKAGYADRAAFIAKLRTDPSYYAKTPEALLQAAAFVAKTIDGKLPAYFGKLPRLPYGLRPIPAETAEGTTTAYYSPGSPASGIAGTYYVNTSKLDQRPLWELPALTAHEAVPGHHNQIALQQELDLSEFRKHQASFTAFVEGWALYTEHLGIEMGLYDTPEKDMGRLSYEMWRACRLVVDTGIHAMGWTKAQAIAFMKENSALSDANIEAEVNRYISWPAQALAYKIGELKIRELRARAEKALGARFDLRRFHDAVLGGGAVPLDLLEARIDAWIASEAKG